MKAVVTGGAGFIGSHLAERLLRDGHEVAIVDNFLTGHRGNIQHLCDDPQLAPHLTVHEQSITELAPLQTIFDGAEVVFHEAALPSVPRSVADPLETHLHCATGTLTVLEAARHSGVRRVVYASSSSVYGDIEGDFKIETMPTVPKSPYGVAKMAAEHYCRVFTEIYGLETVGLRYFNVFGPRQDPTSDYAAVIPRFITRIIDGQPPLIHGDGTQSRDFTYIDNVVHGNMLAAQAPNAAGEVMNLALGHRVRILDLAHKLNDILGSSIVPLHDAERPGDIKHSRADINKARDLLNYEPVVDFDTGLARTAAWYQTRS